MNGERKPKQTQPSQQARPSRHSCHSCKQPVDTVVERHKNMGVYVPTWTAGPCHNPRCEHYVPEQVPITSVRSATWKSLTGWGRH
ncbi:hypothetical protein AB0O67_25380 [Streptomyces sp. NPDC086077]|uniref:hypothetical protein n=1 Tax=Streptomyces sp. NPDC086077 TaxID=3154862 RepID=UPI0034499F69